MSAPRERGRPRAVVVGASLAGLRTAEQLLAAGWAGPVTVIGAERHMPYNRPPLSKEALSGGDLAGAAPAVGRDVAEGAGGAAGAAHPAHAAVALPLRGAAATAVEWRLGREAAACSLERRSLTLEDGEEVAFDALVVASGLRPRRLPLAGGGADRHVVRTLDDAARLRRALRPGARVVVAGGGFIGCETAATARALGCEVTVVEAAAAPLERALGPALGRAVQRLHEEAGVRFRLGVTIAALECGGGAPGGGEHGGTAGGAPAGADRLRGVVLSDGTTVPADVLVEAVGSRPNVEWLAGNGLDLSDGVLCDERLAVAGTADAGVPVVAVGDVARYPNRRFGGVARRVEHWSNAGDTARRAAATVFAQAAGSGEDGPPFQPLPSFWSDQFGVRIQGVGGFAHGDRRALLEGSLEGPDPLRAGVAVGSFDGDRLLGAVVVGLPVARLAVWRREIAASTELMNEREEALA